MIMLLSSIMVSCDVNRKGATCYAPNQFVQLLDGFIKVVYWHCNDSIIIMVLCKGYYYGLAFFYTQSTYFCHHVGSYLPALECLQCNVKIKHFLKHDVFQDEKSLCITFHHNSCSYIYIWQKHIQAHLWRILNQYYWTHLVILLPVQTYQSFIIGLTSVIMSG